MSDNERFLPWRTAGGEHVVDPKKMDRKAAFLKGTETIHMREALRIARQQLEILRTEEDPQKLFRILNDSSYERIKRLILDFYADAHSTFPLFDLYSELDQEVAEVLVQARKRLELSSNRYWLTTLVAFFDFLEVNGGEIRIERGILAPLVFYEFSSNFVVTAPNHFQKNGQTVMVFEPEGKITFLDNQNILGRGNISFGSSQVRYLRSILMNEQPNTLNLPSDVALSCAFILDRFLKMIRPSEIEDPDRILVRS